MRLRRKAWALPELLESDLFIEDPREFKGRWNEIFNNENDICLELGCGKGRFMENIADAIILIGMSVAVWIFAWTGKKINRAEGAIMVALYAGYMGYICIR